MYEYAIHPKNYVIILSLYVMRWQSILPISALGLSFPDASDVSLNIVGKRITLVHK